MGTMQIKANKEGITFSVQGDVGAGNVMLKPRESEQPEEKATFTVHEPVTATFAFQYLVNFAKAAPLCGAVELGLGPLASLLVKSMILRGQTLGTCSFTWRPISASEALHFAGYGVGEAVPWLHIGCSRMVGLFVATRERALRAAASAQLD